MKIWASLLVLSFSCLTALAQPTSFGGITPGKTTREELKSLVQKTDDVGIKDSVITKLKQPEAQMVLILLKKDVVYRVLTVGGGGLSPELKRALIEKYGQPNIKIGAIRTVNCQNKFGATSQRLEGKEQLRWPVKDGVQGEISRVAGICAEDISESYVLSHFATVQAIEEKSKEEAGTETKEKRRKLGDAF